MENTLAITTMVGCKNRCSYCPQDKFINAYMKRSKITTMSFDTFKTCIDKLPPNSSINFSGFSEPWLNPKCGQMIVYAYEKGFGISVNTTIIGMELSDVDLINNIPFIHFIIHLPENKQITNIKVNNKYLSILEKLLNSDISVILKFHLDPLRSVDVHAEIKKYLIKTNRYESLIRSELKTRANNIKIEGKPFQENIQGEIIGCDLLHTNQLMPNGDVFICCMDWQLKYYLGNLLTSSYDSLFKSEAFLKILKGFKDDSSDILCRYCELCLPAPSRYKSFTKKAVQQIRKKVTSDRFIYVSYPKIKSFWQQLNG